MLDFFAAQCAQVAVPEASEQAMRYYNSGNILWILNQAWSLIVPLLFLLWGFTGKMSAFAQRVGKKWYFVIVVYLILYMAISQLLGFPLDFYAGYLRQHAYGLSTETLCHWFGN